VPVRKTGLIAADAPTMKDWVAELVARACAEGVDLTGEHGLLTAAEIVDGG